MIMKRLFSLFALVACGLTFVMATPPDITYNGQVLPWNTDWKRDACGTLDIKKNIIEVSGMACSRVTPGYLWMQSDEIQDCIIATDETGAERACKVKFPKSIRWDWEDLSGGVYNGKDYLFIGAFGDNDETDGNYAIIYFEEPAIPSGNPEIAVTPSVINYQYPNGLKHNTEALMYDNLTQTIYIITKIYYNVCQVFSLPFRTDYGSDTQTLTYVCDLGIKADLGTKTNPDEGFHLVTAADISPDGKYILIKNQNNTNADYSWILLWERQGSEAVSETLKRQPQPLQCYAVEWQGEAICWLDDYTFYTTSDSDDGNPPIYKYTRKKPAQKRTITIDGNLSEWDDPEGLAQATLVGTSDYDKLYDIRFYANEQNIYFYLEYSAEAEKVEHIDILLSTDNNSSTGHNAWMWDHSASEFLIEAAPTGNFQSTEFYVFRDTYSQDDWDGWQLSSITDVAYACSPVTLTNGHKAIEGQIFVSKLPSPVLALEVGVFTSNKDWAESGVLPLLWGNTLEVPIYREPTGFDQITNDNSPMTIKVIRDGRLFILRDGKTYNATGQEVR
jgi:hypothetical protein